MNNAELIVATLRKAGIARGFGIPSGNVLPLIEAMRTGGIEFVLTAHEGSAGFAAEVTGRQTRRPGLAIATVGPGATNLATGVGGAFLDRSPMIAITCNLPVAQLGRRIQMGIDHHALFRPIAKATLPLREGSVAATVAEAVRIALSEPEGPVHLDLPEDVATAQARETVPDIPEGARLDPPASDAIASVLRAMAAAKRPVAVIGADARRLHDVGALRRVIERHGLPFAHTTMAKGLVDDAHPLAVGCIERACRQLQRDFLRGADLIVGLGYDTIEAEYEAWIGTVPLVQVGISPVDTDGTVKIAAQANGDLDAALAVLAVAPPSRNEWTADALATHRAQFNAALRPNVPGFTPHHAIDAVRSVLPADGVLAFDVGAHTHQIASQWAACAPNRFLITNGWSSMGFGLPAAIAAKLAAPELPVVCLLGDGCFQMSCGELAVARRLGLALPVVVLDDRILGLIQVKQARRQMPAYGTDLQAEPYGDPPAHYFGVPALGVRDAAALSRALDAALAASGPTVIEAVVDPAHYWDTVFD